MKGVTYMAKKEENDVVKEKQDIRFSKEQILGFAQFSNRADLLKALLDSNKSYTKEEVTNLINNFMIKKVR
jgi:hypothetical protein